MSSYGKMMDPSGFVMDCNGMVCHPYWFITQLMAQNRRPVTNRYA